MSALKAGFPGVALKKRLSFTADGLANFCLTLTRHQSLEPERKPSLDNLPPEVIQIILRHIPLSSLSAFARTSRTSMFHVKQYLLCSKFQERMILEEYCHRHILLPLPEDDLMSFAVQFFKKHFWSTTHSFHWFAFMSDVSCTFIFRF